MKYHVFAWNNTPFNFKTSFGFESLARLKKKQCLLIFKSNVSYCKNHIASKPEGSNESYQG